MRQLIVQVPRGRGGDVLAIARKHRGMNLARFEARGSDEPLDLAVVHVPNTEVGALITDLEAIESLHVSFAPQGFLTLRPPPDEAPDQVKDVTFRSPVEVFLGGVQSVGSWTGFTGYAVAAGAVAWIGLFTNTVYLLTASMLIAPFAGPAMNAALATARGDSHLLGRSLLRYFAGLAITILVTALLSFVLSQDVATSQMVSTSAISSTAVLLPLVAGAAGALNLVQSGRSSLVSGAATGMLVAASLAPPAGLVGMAGALSEWAMALDGLFVLLLQVLGINLSGALVFRACGLMPEGKRYARGRSWVFWTGIAATAAILAGLLVVQFWKPPSLQRSTRQQRAAASVQDVVDSSGIARLVEANVRFTRADIPGQNSLLIVLYVQREADEATSDEEIRRRLGRAVRARLRAEGYRVTPLVSINVVQDGD